MPSTLLPKIRRLFCLLPFVSGMTPATFGMDITSEALGEFPKNVAVVQTIVSADGRNVLMVVRPAQGPMEVWLNGTKVGSDEVITGAALNRDGTRFAFVSRKDNTSTVNLDGESPRRFPGIESTFSGDNHMSVIHFSPDGKHFGYVATHEDGSESVVVDNTLFTCKM